VHLHLAVTVPEAAPPRQADKTNTSNELCSVLIALDQVPLPPPPPSARDEFQKTGVTRRDDMASSGSAKERPGGHGSENLDSLRQELQGADKAHKGMERWFTGDFPGGIHVCYSVVQCGAVWCSVVQCGAAWCSVVQRGAAWCSVVQRGAVQCKAVKCGSVRYVTHMSLTSQIRTHSVWINAVACAVKVGGYCRGCARTQSRYT